MKSLALIMFALPFFALSQNNTKVNVVEYSVLSNTNEMEKHDNYNALIRLENTINTALINDIKKEKPALDFNANKPYHLSAILKKDQFINFIDNQKPSKMQLKTIPLMDYNKQL